MQRHGAGERDHRHFIVNNFVIIKVVVDEYVYRATAPPERPGAGCIGTASRIGHAEVPPIEADIVVAVFVVSHIYVGMYRGADVV